MVQFLGNVRRGFLPHRSKGVKADYGGEIIGLHEITRRGLFKTMMIVFEEEKYCISGFGERQGKAVVIRHQPLVPYPTEVDL